MQARREVWSSVLSRARGSIAMNQHQMNKLIRDAWNMHPPPDFDQIENVLSDVVDLVIASDTKLDRDSPSPTLDHDSLHELRCVLVAIEMVRQCRQLSISMPQGGSSDAL